MVQKTRATLEYKNCSKRFIINEANIRECFERQYFHFYRTRVRCLKPRIIKNAKQLIDENIKVCPLREATHHMPVLVIGVVVKRVALRPSVLKKLAANELMVPEPFTHEKLVGGRDCLEFEDENQVIRLRGSIDFDDVWTGVVVGVYGVYRGDDAFDVEQLIWPLPVFNKFQPVLKCDRFVMFLSGLSFAGTDEMCENHILSLDLLQKWIGGYMSISKKERHVVENLSRLVIAGQSIAITDQGREFSTAARYLIRYEEAPSVKYSAHLDHFLSKISSLLEVDVMPGLGDPTTHLQPQQPIHRAVFLRASEYGKMLNLVTNPYHFCLDGIHIMGTSGENISDMKQYCRGDVSDIDILDRLVTYQHLAPTIPDTIDGFPYFDRDPFIIDELPHILFAANQNSFDYTIKDFGNGNRMLLLQVPSFAKTCSVVIVNLRSLEAIQQNFSFDDDVAS